MSVITYLLSLEVKRFEKQILTERHEFIKRISDISPSEDVVDDLAMQGLGQNKIKFSLYTNRDGTDDARRHHPTNITAGVIIIVVYIEEGFYSICD